MINKVRSTQNELTSNYSQLTTKAIGFTMAEILLSLTIIGVVAAITLPSLTGNINERTWNTQRKALYARMSQAISLMPALNTYANSETFLSAGLAKVLKINNICDSDHLQDCGIPSKYTNRLGSTSTMPTTLSGLNPSLVSYSYDWTDGTGVVHHESFEQEDGNATAFETANGESILLFYSPRCVSNLNEKGTYNAQAKMCLNMIYDLNGKKGPNTYGKDLGHITVFYPTDSEVVAPMPANNTISAVAYENITGICRNNLGDEYRMPNTLELSSFYVNSKFFGASNTNFWSSTRAANKRANWFISFGSGLWGYDGSGRNRDVICVKRN